MFYRFNVKQRGNVFAWVITIVETHRHCTIEYKHIIRLFDNIYVTYQVFI